LVFPKWEMEEKREKYFFLFDFSYLRDGEDRTRMWLGGTKTGFFFWFFLNLIYGEEKRRIFVLGSFGQRNGEERKEKWVCSHIWVEEKVGDKGGKGNKEIIPPKYILFPRYMYKGFFTRETKPLGSFTCENRLGVFRLRNII